MSRLQLSAWVVLLVSALMLSGCIGGPTTAQIIEHLKHDDVPNDTTAWRWVQTDDTGGESLELFLGRVLADSRQPEVLGFRESEILKSDAELLKEKTPPLRFNHEQITGLCVDNAKPGDFKIVPENVVVDRLSVARESGAKLGYLGFVEYSWGNNDFFQLTVTRVLHGHMERVAIDRFNGQYTANRFWEDKLFAGTPANPGSKNYAYLIKSVDVYQISAIGLQKVESGGGFSGYGLVIGGSVACKVNTEKTRYLIRLGLQQLQSRP